MFGRDIWYSIAMKSDDKDILNMLSVNRKFNEPEFFQLVFRNKYPLLEKFKREDQSWKEFYLTMINYIYKLKEEYNFDYVPAPSLNPKYIYNKIKNEELDDESREWIHMEFSGETGDLKYLEKYLQEEYLYENLLSMVEGISLSGNLPLLQKVLKRYEITKEETKSLFTFKILTNSLVSDNSDMIKFIKKESSYPQKNIDQAELEAAIKRNDYEEFLNFLQNFSNSITMNYKEDLALLSVEYNNLKVVKYLSEEGIGNVGELVNECMIYDREEILKYLLTLKKENFDIENLIDLARRYDNEYLIEILAKNLPKYHMYDDTTFLLSWMIEKGKVDENFKNIVAEKMYFGGPDHIEDFIERYPNLVSPRLVEKVKELANKYPKFEKIAKKLRVKTPKKMYVYLDKDDKEDEGGKYLLFNNFEKMKNYLFENKKIDKKSYMLSEKDFLDKKIVSIGTHHK
jgi:hypothetical protein